MPAGAELFTVVPPAEALQRLLSALPLAQRAVDLVPTPSALGRIVASDVISPEDLPQFARSVVDGFAVHAQDTHGASPGLPSLLRVVGEAPMGCAVTQHVSHGQAMLVHTGSMLPPGANAVVMVEHTQRINAADAEIEIMRAVANDENVLQRGEDVRLGQTVLTAGHRIRPQDIGGLMALGILAIAVARPPRVGIVSSGDEVIPAEQNPLPGQVRDVNSHALAALIQQAGASVTSYGISPDDAAALHAMTARAHAENDMLILSAGSSVSARDMSIDAIAALGAPGVLAHGISLKPGKPSIVACCAGKPVIGLPGNPVSAMVVADVLVLPILRALLGERKPTPPASIRARLSRNLASTSGREDHVQVRVEAREDGLWAVPVLGKSNMIYTMVNAHGHILIGMNANGLTQGDWVDVFA